MRRLRVTRKKVKPIRNELAVNARDIILSIFSMETDAEKLEYSKSNWGNSTRSKRQKLFVSQVKLGYQPLKQLYPFLQIIANGVDIEICSYLFIDGDKMKVVYKERKVIISNSRFNCNRVKYWLSHIYFQKFRNQLAEHLLDQPKNTARQTINTFQEKEYMPKVLRGVAKHSAPFIRQIKVSPDARYRRNSQPEKQPFCIVYNKNGSEQEFNFSEMLSFVDYTFNLKDIIYIKILSKNQKNSMPIGLRYCKSNESRDQIQKLKKFRNIFSRKVGWELLRQEFEEIKYQLLTNEHFDNYCNLLQLQAVAYIEVKNSLAVDELETSWILSKNKGVILTNVAKFTTMEATIVQFHDGIGVITSKTQETSPRINSRLEASIRYKRFKSEDNQKSFIPLETVEKATKPNSRLESHDNSLFKTKGRSVVMRGPYGLFT